MPSLIGRCGGGGGALSPLYGVYASNDQTIASGATATMEWVYSIGDHVLNLTDPFNPAPATKGVYWIGCQCTSATIGWTAGRSLTAQIDLVNATFPINGVVDVFPNAFGNILTANPEALSPLATTDYIQLLMQNGDSGARAMRAGPMYVVRIGTY